MQTIFFNGFCPQCNLTGFGVKMYYNIDHDLECPVCNLRLYHDSNKIAMIYRNRGKNEFALRLTPIICKDFLFTQSDIFSDSYSNGVILHNENDLKNYIESIKPTSYTNMYNLLLESYIDYYFENANEEFYKLMIHLTQIDLSQVLYDKDVANTTKELFRFMHFCIECYKEIDYKPILKLRSNPTLNPFIEEYIIVNEDLLNSELFLQKVVLQNLILNLIQVIYSPIPKTMV